MTGIGAGSGAAVAGAATGAPGAGSQGGNPPSGQQSGGAEQSPSGAQPQGAPQSGQQSAGTSQPGQQPGQQQSPQERFNPNPTLDRLMAAPESVDPSKFVPDGGNFDAQSMQSYQDAMRRHAEITRFQDGVRQALNKPLTVDGVSVSFASEGEVNQFISFARQVTTSPRPEQLVRLFFMDRIVKLAREQGGRQYERSVASQQQSQAGQQSGQSAQQQGQQQVVLPNQSGTTQPQRPTNDPFGRVPSTRELHKQMYPEHFEKVRRGDEKLL